MTHEDNFYGRFLKTVDIVVREFIAEPAVCNQNIDKFQIETLLNNGRPLEAYFICTKENQGFANYTKSVVFLDPKALLHSHKRDVLHNLWTHKLENDHCGWISHPYNSDKELYRHIKMKMTENCIAKSNEVTNDTYANLACTDSYMLSGTYLHEVLAPENLFPLLMDHFFKTHLDKKPTCHVSGRVPCWRFPVVGSTPDGIISTIQDETEFAAKLMSDVDFKVKTLADGKNVTAHLIDDEQVLFGAADTNHTKFSGNRKSCSDHVLGIVELKTYGKPYISSVDVAEIGKHVDDWQSMSTYLQTVLDRCFIEAKKLPSSPAQGTRRKFSPIFNKNNCFAKRVDLGNQYNGSILYPKKNYPLFYMDEKNVDYGYVHYTEVFQEQPRAVCFVFDVDKEENELLYTHVWDIKTTEPPPYLLVPHAEVTRQMLDQKFAMDRPGITSIYVGLVKAWRADSCAPLDRKWTTKNRLGIAYCLQINFNDEDVEAVGKRLLEQLRSRNYVPEKDANFIASNVQTLAEIGNVRLQTQQPSNSDDTDEDNCMFRKQNLKRINPFVLAARQKKVKREAELKEKRNVLTNIEHRKVLLKQKIMQSSKPPPYDMLAVEKVPAFLPIIGQHEENKNLERDIFSTVENVDRGGNDHQNNENTWDCDIDDETFLLACEGY